MKTPHLSLSLPSQFAEESSRKGDLEQKSVDRREQAIRNRLCLHELPTAAQIQSPTHEPQGSTSNIEQNLNRAGRGGT